MSVAARVTETLLTCEAVLAETAFHLWSVSLVLAIIRDKLIALASTVKTTCLSWQPLRAAMEITSLI